MKRSCIFFSVVIMMQLTSSCKKEIKSSPQENSSTGVVLQPTITAATLSQVNFSAAGNFYSYVKGEDSIKSTMAGMTCLNASPHYAYYNSMFYAGTNSTIYKVNFLVGKLFFTGSQPTYTEFENYFIGGNDLGVGDYPLSDGVDIGFVDNNNYTWNSVGGSGFGNSFKVLESIKIIEDSYGIMYKVKYKFTACMIKPNTSFSDTIMIHGTLIADHFQSK
jgi:hypothetical protein